MIEEQTMTNKAAMIADLIDKTDTQKRGDLLKKIASHLQSRSQYYTASLIMKAAQEYGFDVPNVKSQEQTEAPNVHKDKT